MQTIVIPVGSLLPPELEMRQIMTMEGLDELAASIRKHGILEPLLVRKDGGNYRVVAGARRFEAARRLGLDGVPCNVMDVDERTAEEIKIHENLKREDVNPIEEADYYFQLYAEKDFSVDKLVEMTGRSYNYIEERLEMAKWPADVKAAIQGKAIKIAVGRELVKFKDAEVRTRFLHSAVDFQAPSNVVKGWRERWEAELAAAERGAGEGGGGSAAAPPPPPVVSCALCGEDTHGMIVVYVPVSQRCEHELQYIRMETERRRAEALARVSADSPKV